MAFLETEWDYTLKQEVFKLSGDVGYTHTTDVLLKKRTSTPVRTDSIDYAVLHMNVDVIRNIGSSKIALYDNGEPIPFYIGNNAYDLYNWGEQTTYKNITARLNYDVPHVLEMRYLGNSSCLPSSSQKIKLTVPRPSARLPNIILTPVHNSPVEEQFLYSFEMDEYVSIDGQLSAENNSFTKNQTIHRYIDSIFDATSHTQADSTFHYNINNSKIGLGLHTVTVKYDGSQDLYSNETTITVSKGFQIEVLEYPSFFVGTPNEQVKVRIMDWFGTPVEGKTLELQDLEGGVISSAISDEDGIATFTELDREMLASKIRAYYNGCYSRTMSITIVDIGQLQFTSTNVFTAKDQVTSLRLQAEVFDMEGVPISAPKLPVYQTQPVESVVYLNKNNSATLQVEGDGEGSKYVEVMAGVETASITVPDYLQYWTSRSNSLNKNYKILSNRFLELATGFKLQAAEDGFASIVIGDDSEFNEQYNVEFTVKMVSSDSLKIGLCAYNKGNLVGNVSISTMSLKANDIVKIINDNGTGRVLINNVESHTYRASTGYLVLTLIGKDSSFSNIGDFDVLYDSVSTKSEYLMFDLLKFSKRSD